MENFFLEMLEKVFPAEGRSIYIILAAFFLLSSFIAAIAPESYKEATFDFWLFTSVLIFVMFLFFCCYYNGYLPKGQKKKIGIIIAISTENNKQKQRLRSLLAQKLMENLKNAGMGDLFFVKLLEEKETNKLVNVIESYNANKLAIGKPAKKWFKVRKRLRSHFVVWGNVIECNMASSGNTYIIKTNAIVAHAKANEEFRKNLLGEFGELWIKEVQIDDKCEYEGFNAHADEVDVCIRFIVGNAALLSGDVNLALQLHMSLWEGLPSTGLSVTFRRIKSKLVGLIAFEEVILAKKCFMNDKQAAAVHVQKALEVDATSIDAYLFGAIVKLENGDVDGSMDFVYSAKANSKNKGNAWMYSMAFLHLIKGNLKAAMKLYKKISRRRWSDRQEGVLQSVYEHMGYFLEENKEAYFIYFARGYLYYKVDGNLALAWSDFDTFIREVNSCDKYKTMIEKAKNWRYETERKMDELSKRRGLRRFL